MSQKDIVYNLEGDAIFKRLKDKLGKNNYDERLNNIIETSGIYPKSILEIGSGNGWRLDYLRKKYDAECYGIEPSPEAIMEGNIMFPEIALMRGTADSLPFEKDKFDLVIFGFFYTFVIEGIYLKSLMKQTGYWIIWAT